MEFRWKTTEYEHISTASVRRETHLKTPDIWQLAGAAVLVMPQEIVDLLDPVVSEAGELLSLTISSADERLLLLNVLQVINCLDRVGINRERFEIRPELIEHRLPKTGLFKIPETAAVDIFSIERDDDDDSFRRRVQDLGVRGLTFQCVWSSTDGAADVNLMRP